MIERRGKWQFFPNFSISFLLFPKRLFFAAASLPIFLLRICVDLKKKEEKISPYSILYIYNSTIHSLIFLFLLFFFFILELIVSFKYISCAKRHEGDIKNRNLQYKFFFSAAACYVRYTIYFFIFSGAHTDIESRYAYASSPMCFVSLSTEVELFFFLCLLPLKEKLE